MIEVLDGLAFAHELTDDEGRPRNIVHRDVSPSNIFISQQGETKLGDFGIAKERESSALTRTGQLKGKVAYMAPEQLYGDPIDQRADVFSAGVVLWEALTQARLFGGRPDIGAMKLIVSGERVPPSTLVPDIPLALDACVLGALEVDREKRTQSARDMQSQLLDIMLVVHPITRPKDVRGTLETLLGTRKAEGPGLTLDRTSASVGPGFLETGSGSLQPDTESWDVPPEREPGEPSLLPTDLDLSFEKSRLSTNARQKRIMPVTADQKAFSIPPATVAEFSHVPVDDLKLPDESRPRSSKSQIDDPEDPSNWLVASHEVHAQASARVMELVQTPWDSHGLEEGAYTGTYRFWLKDIGGRKLGPLSFEQVQRLVRAEAHLRLTAKAQISADDLCWSDLDLFAELTGQEGLLFDENARLPVEGDLVGFLDQRSMASLSALITRERLTGRLMMTPEGLRRSIYREIHLVKGAPTYVFANEEALQLPEVLVQRKVLARERLPEAIHTSLKTNRPLDEIASSLPEGPVAPQHAGHRVRTLWMKDRLVDMYRWTAGRFVFVAVQAEEAQPWARSLFSLLPELVHRSFSPELLRSFTLGYLKAKFKPTPKLETELDELGLSPVQKEIALKLASGKKLSTLIMMRPEEERLHLLVTYILVEAELLVRV
jgi:serine/threonine protein kinase